MKRPPVHKPAEPQAGRDPGARPDAHPGPSGRGQRRSRLHGLSAALLALAALAGLAGGDGPDRRPESAGPPGPQEAAGAIYRADGGQSLSSSGPLTPNQLTELNLGRTIDLKSARPDLLAHFPSLGPNSAVRAIDSGCLNSRQQKTLDGLISETCDRNKP